MSVENKWSILFIKQDNSKFDAETKVFNTAFKRVDRVLGREEALEFFQNNSYDIVISDLSVEPEELAFLKQIQDIKEGQCIFAMVDPKDEDKLYSIADLGINAFELIPEHFDQALEQIALFDPYEEQ